METKAYSIIEEAYKEYYPVIYRYVRCRIKCKYEVEDLVQDVFMRLLDYDNMLQKSTIQSFFSLSHVILWQTICAVIIENRKWYRAPMKMLLNLLVDLKKKSLLKIYFHGKMRLSVFPQQRQRVYSMSRFEEKTLSEISKELQLSMSTVENHLFIGRKIMRNYIRMCI